VEDEEEAEEVVESCAPRRRGVETAAVIRAPSGHVCWRRGVQGKGVPVVVVVVVVDVDPLLVVVEV
jgi:hypothetical protein